MEKYGPNMALYTVLRNQFMNDHDSVRKTTRKEDLLFLIREILISYAYQHFSPRLGRLNYGDLISKELIRFIGQIEISFYFLAKGINSYSYCAILKSSAKALLRRSIRLQSIQVTPMILLNMEDSLGTCAPQWTSTIRLCKSKVGSLWIA